MWKLINTKIIPHILLISFYGTICFAAFQDAYADDQLYTVKKGDTLWSISEQLLHDARDWPKLQRLNNIKDPFKLAPNSQIKIPILLQKKNQNLAVVKHVQGRVVIINSMGQRRETVVGMELEKGDEIKTYSASSVRIEFKDGSASLLQENSQMKVGVVEFTDKKRDVQLHLQRGAIDNEIKKRKHDNSRFKITTPSAAASVRGTRFRVADDPLTQLFRAEVLSGSITISSQGEEQLLEKGFGAIVKMGEPPSKPQKLLPPVNISHLQKNVQNIPIIFQFIAITNAIGYRVEVSQGKTFTQQIFSQEISEPSVNLSNLSNGQYIMRIFAYDNRGLGGEIAYHKFEIALSAQAAPPDVPTLIYPDNHLLLQQNRFSFRWSESSNANAYRFQLASDENFQQLLIDIFPYNFTQLSISDRLPSGKYYWHIAALNRSNEVDSYTEANTFRIPPLVPTLAEIGYEDDKALVIWSKGKNALRYRLQVSSNSDFSNPVLDKIISSSRYQIELEALGNYFIRVNSIDLDGFISEASNIRQVKLSKSGFFSRKLDNINNSTAKLNEF